MEKEKIADLRAFVSYMKSNPSDINDPSLAFFKDYLLSLGAPIPAKSTPRSPKAEQDFSDLEDEIIESDLELDGEIIEPENDPLPQMGDFAKEVSEEDRDAAQMHKSNAIEALSEGNLEEAISQLTMAILLNPTSSILYATRASVFVKLKRPNAAIVDANRATEINPDSAKGYKSRGMAKAMLGKWEEAASDLHLAAKLDFDEEINVVLKQVEPIVHKIEEHRRKYERLRKEREMKKAQAERQRRRAEAESHQKANKSSESKPSASNGSPGSQDGQVIVVRSQHDLTTRLKAASNASRLSILYFTATWCGPCRVMAPLFVKLAQKHPQVVFLKLDIDQLGSVAQEWNVTSVPTFFFVKNGKTVDTVVGADKNGLERSIALHAK
ncbi:TPR repeat-containing thioredoxin TDX isoform X1 [Carex littledalei]|uniref:TPR repeat-containing thioredoxin TDX isoform X1 n=1 Tax=Carex littledalei TaxID=544730 RepID=A0A833VFJ0_9POAL|nr:TPR repeat-containing thioredoxin TDX isoform X1 [Carex littledalei]